MENYGDLIQKQRRFFTEGKTKDVSFRMEALSKLRSVIKQHEQELMDALKADLNKSEFDAYLTEIGILLEEIRFTMKHLKKWAKPRKVKSTIAQIGSKSYIYPEPYGVSLIIAPWNYPFQLAIAPLIGAIAAGNCAILKPSELTPQTSALLSKLISNHFPEEYIAAVEGDAETSTALLNEKLDYIFFTGSVPVGKIIMEAAAKNLTPVTLELGGKSPCIIHEDANLKLAAKRIAWGKYINAGQTCVAPDYLYVHSRVKEEFLKELKQAILELYGEDPIASGSFTRIVSEKHFSRLSKFLADGTVIHGGRYDSTALSIEPTVLSDITWNDKVMEDEIFGPILPVLEYEDLSMMIGEVTARPKPLALYIFTESEGVQKQILSSISFGGGCINDTVYHLSSPYLPFGGVGESGIGAYHGKGSFDVFSHEKSILKQTTRFDLPFRYPTTKNALKKVKFFIK
ncbi:MULTISPECIES: aldehyde dehydrogenase [unclassified Cytobacillus]|uniref:aldehyde dehydrogenase n=1 Tax=unclassified Cytobacillus TaxID=2675268 RepID=UPI00135A1CEF|nr:aldehyde dehydrogenase [Cytobacillus sp. AMY 15.2]KAF0817834.1 Aldehyde dehydrogenase [Bacillus sp. ZZV12-4809]MCM3089929.1 aldehyde dehydrogenase [Cytobacillus sp. AMY 15.2]